MKWKGTTSFDLSQGSSSGSEKEMKYMYFEDNFLGRKKRFTIKIRATRNE
jgi:hypothetical protein